MRGLTKAAALLLAPALARASLFSHHEPKSDTRTPLAVVDFDVPTGRHGVDNLALKVDVEESEDICGETDLSINGKKLTYDEHGSGSGDVRVGDKTVTAHWLLSCVMTHTEPEAQLLRFAIDKINGHSVDVSELLLTFRKTAPALVLDFHGAQENSHKGKGKGHHKGELPDIDDELEAQIQELEVLRAQAEDLLELIHEKEMAIQERFGERGGDHRHPPPPPPGFSALRDCDSIQCVVHTLTEKVKHTAGDICGDWFKHGRHPHGWGGPDGERRPPHGGPRHKLPGNHSHPVPPHHRPDFCPPCHGPPGEFPPLPHHGEHPPPEDDERPLPPPPDHEGHPPPPPPEDGDDELFGEFSAPPPHMPHHSEHPPPPPGHGDHPPPPPPEDMEHGHRHGGHGHDFPPMEFEGDEGHPHPPHHEGHPPPPPHGHGGPHGHHHGPPPHNPVIMTFGMAAIALAFFSVIGLGYIHRRIHRLTPESRRAIRRAIRRSDNDRRSRRNDRHGFLGRFFARWTGEDDEEKESMLRGRSDSEDSVTMEQEIARFREAAFMVEGLVAAEEGRNAHRMHPHPHPHYYHHPPPPPPPPHPHHLHHPHPHGPPPPPPPPPPPRPPMIPENHDETVYPSFVPNERLPSYNDEQHDSSVVSDGCRYTPGSSDYAPSESASNTNDVLGDSKKN